MKYKLRVFYYPNTDNVMKIAHKIADSFGAVCDQIPPAFNCENERLVILGVDLYKAKKEPLMHFLKNLNVGRTKNIAFYAIGDEAIKEIDNLRKTVTRNGVKPVGDTYICEVKNSLFKRGELSLSQTDRSVKWVEQVIELINKQ